MTTQVIVAVAGAGFILLFAAITLALIWQEVKLRRQQRAVETIEQLKLLPNGAVVRDQEGRIWQKDETNWWLGLGEEFTCADEEVFLPAHVIYLPGVGE